MSIGLLGRKIGMTRVYDESGRAIPVTVIEAGSNSVLQVKTTETDGYAAVQVGFDDQKEHRVNAPQLGHFAKAGSTPKKFIREFRCESDAEATGEINVSLSCFQKGQYVDVIGKSKGKGFAGAMKKHNFHGQEQAHGSMMHRRTGAVAAGSTPGRVFKNQGMPGHLGDERITVQNLKIVQVREDDGVLLISGAVPGAKGSYVVIRPAKKKPATVDGGNEQ